MDLLTITDVNNVKLTSKVVFNNKEFEPQEIFLKDNKIVTDKLNVDDIVVEISKRSDLNLLKDNRKFLRKRIDKILTTIKHIR